MLGHDRDNRPDFVSQALGDRCRFAGAATGYIEPGAPWQNRFIESFNGHLRGELIDLESFNRLFGSQLLLEDLAAPSATTIDHINP